MSARTLNRECHGIDLPESARAALEALSRVREIERIIVFGSRAVGDHEDRSDFDVAVSAPGLDSEALTRIRDELDRARTLFKISLSSLESMPEPLKGRVLAQGVMIYERPEAAG